MDEKEVRDMIVDVLIEQCDEGVLDVDMPDDLREILTFEEVGMLTTDKGLVIKMGDGSEFCITVRKSK